MKKENIPLMVGISIPILMIIFVAISIYLPSLFVQPKTDFLYSTGGDYYSQDIYSVQNGKLIVQEISYPKEYYRPKRNPRLFIHDVVKNESREISLEEAKKLNLNSNNKSPDGFEVVYGRNHHDIFPLFFYGDTDYNTRYIQKGGRSKRLNLQTDGERYYSYYFKFIGWIIK